jgi:DNA polymerase V
MIGAGIYPEDIVVVDRSLSVQQRDVVVAEVEGEFLIKRFLRQNGNIILASENPAFRPLVFMPGMDLEIFGVVTFTLHRHRSKRRVRW